MKKSATTVRFFKTGSKQNSFGNLRAISCSKEIKSSAKGPLKRANDLVNTNRNKSLFSPAFGRHHLANHTHSAFEKFRNFRSFQVSHKLQKSFDKPVYGENDRKLVILGTGWAGFRLAKEVQIASKDPNKPGYQVNIISPRNHFLFTPLLPSTCTGTIEFRGISEPIRNCRPGLNYIQFEATKIDAEKKIIEAKSYYKERETEADTPHHRSKISERF